MGGWCRVRSEERGPGSRVADPSTLRLRCPSLRVKLNSGLLLANRRGRHVRVTMVGHGPMGPDIDAAIAEAGLSEVITRIDRIDDPQELWGLMKGAAVVLAPSDREGFGLVAAESLAMGTPVVTSTHRDNAAALLVSDGVTGSCCGVDDIDGYATACEKWLDQPRNSAAISEAFWAAHRELDWAESSKRWLEVLRATAERRPVPPLT